MKSIFKILTYFVVILITLSCEDKLKVDQEQIALKKLRTFQSLFETSIIETRTSKVKRGQGLFQVINSLGLDNKITLDILNQLRDYVELDKLKVGDEVQLGLNGKNEKVHFSFRQNIAEYHQLTRNNESDKWEYDFVQEPTQWKERIVTGALKAGSNLQDSLRALGLSNKVVGEIVNVLLCKVNFRFDAREGDNFKVLLKERYFGDKILNTKILYTQYNGKRAGKSEAYYFEDSEEKSTYTAHYTEDGEALIRSGLRYPMRRLHIRSNYGHRIHPVTGRRQMHRGVDLRGRVGEPVHAVAHGVVIESTFNKYAGNKIAIRHADKSVSYYLHLHKRFVRKGQRVKSYQKIGSVGATGRVTGPHLHFGFRKSNGRWMNPMHKRMIATPKLKGEKLASLQKQILHTKVVLNEVEKRNISQNQKRDLASEKNHNTSI